MKILFVASEVVPFAKTGGLADVAGSLPKELRRLGHDVRIILPLYKTLVKGNAEIVREVPAISVPFGASAIKGAVQRTSLDDITVYLLENDRFFGRDYLYGTPSGDYPDNAVRFAFFCRGVLEFLKLTGFRPDIIHCHDWQSALVPILLRNQKSSYPSLDGSAVLYTIHNLAYQGLFPRESLAQMGLDQSYFTVGMLEYYGKVNLMKGAILSADLINTVSQTYCREILGPELGCGLDGILNSRKDNLYGIVNGLDYTEWDPAYDNEIAAPYTADSPENKMRDKQDLQRLLGLDQSPGTPLFGIVSRLSAQKGLDLVAQLLPRMAGENLQLAVLGAGEEKFVRLLSGATGRHSGNISFTFGYEPALAHKIYAGCDMFLMPSRYEPCGLGQLIALRYGTVPVVRKTGGLADTVRDSRDSREPTGFCFNEYAAAALWGAMTRALRTWKEKERWREMIRYGMKADFSWHHSAGEYQKLYERCLKKKGPGDE